MRGQWRHHAHRWVRALAVARERRSCDVGPSQICVYTSGLNPMELADDGLQMPARMGCPTEKFLLRGSPAWQVGDDPRPKHGVDRERCAPLFLSASSPPAYLGTPPSRIHILRPKCQSERYGRSRHAA